MTSTSTGVRGATGLLALMLLVSCGGRNPLERRQVVLDEKRPLADGQEVYFPVDSGRYRVEVTSEGDGVTVDWRGAPCGISPEVHSYAQDCEFAAAGQIVVRNPREAGEGVPANLHLKITRVGP